MNTPTFNKHENFILLGIPHRGSFNKNWTDKKQEGIYLSFIFFALEAVLFVS